MIGIEYKDTFAAKGSALYAALVEGKAEEAARIYAETSARYQAVLHGLAVPRVVFELNSAGERNGRWSIQSPDAEWDKQGRMKGPKK